MALLFHQVRLLTGQWLLAGDGLVTLIGDGLWLLEPVLQTKIVSSIADDEHGQTKNAYLATANFGVDTKHGAAFTCV